MTDLPYGLSNLRLEVEVPVEGLPNLVQNPSGEEGLAGWLTPIESTYFDTSIDPGDEYPTLQFSTLIAQPVWFTTDFLPVVPGYYVATRYDVAGYADSATTLRVSYEFYDANKAYLSTSTQGPNGVGTLGATNWAPAVQVPAGIAYVKTVFRMYRGAASNPLVGDYFRFRKAMTTLAPTTAALGTYRTNMIPNPSGEQSTIGWSGVSATLVSANDGQATVGTKCIRAACGPERESKVYAHRTNGSPIGVEGGKSYVFSIKTKARTAPRGVKVFTEFFSGTKMKLAPLMRHRINSTTEWIEIRFAFTVPSDCNGVRFLMEIQRPLRGEQHYFDRRSWGSSRRRRRTSMGLGRTPRT